MPGLPSATSSVKLAAGLLAAALIAVGCAPQEDQPDIPLSTESTFVVHTPDSLNDAGRTPSVTLDGEGNPVVSYLLLAAVLREGDIPPPVIPGHPQPPAVMLASLSTEGVWQRVSVTPQKTSPAEGDAPEIANRENQAGPPVHTGLAIDEQGGQHVAWSTPRGLFYATDTGGSFAEPERVVDGETVGASIAVGGDGTPWISFYAGNTVRAATRSGTSWSTQDVGPGDGPENPWTRTTAVRVGGDGQPVVAYGNNERTVVATRSGGGWQTEQVSGDGGVGVSLALDTDNNPHVAYYDTNGGVYHAHSVGGAPWEVTQLGTTTPAPPSPLPSPQATPTAPDESPSPEGSPAQESPSPGASPSPQGSPSPQESPEPEPSPAPQASPIQQGPEDPRWTTGIALDQEGVHYVAWADTRNERIELATNRGGEFRSQPILNSEAGGNPSIAVSGDGRSLGLAWYDSAEEDLAVATGGRQEVALAFSPQPPSRPSPGQPPPDTGTDAPCQPEGGETQLQIAAPPGAAASGFDETCLAVAANTEFSVVFSNDDPQVPHNWSPYVDSAAQARPEGAPEEFELITGPAETTYELPALDPGEYFFRCDVHPTTMTGTLVVAEA
ncbi:MAG: hypothetical protein M3N24_10170 [Actinomycetota bacterium]|nr:hypothetical protein [Actinomycetota bacterium]